LAAWVCDDGPVDLVQSEKEWKRDITAWGQDTEVLGFLGGGLQGDVREVRVENRRGVGRLSNRSRAALDWELNLLVRLAGMDFRVPALIPTKSGGRRSEYLVVTEWINGREATDDDGARRARYFHRLHELTVDWSQRPGFRSARDLVSVTTGGDIDLSVLPEDVVSVCRAAWDGLPVGPSCVVHGAPDPDNCIVSYDGDVVLIDWDRARVDHPWFDLAVLPIEATGLTERQYRLARRASYAWDAAVSWRSDPDYARRRLREMTFLD
jgi:Ser/Thr protein kinase RdoA (MazF antagonist)